MGKLIFGGFFGLLILVIVLGIIALPIWGLLLLVFDVNYFAVLICLLVLWIIKQLFFD